MLHMQPMNDGMTTDILYTKDIRFSLLITHSMEVPRVISTGVPNSKSLWRGVYCLQSLWWVLYHVKNSRNILVSLLCIFISEFRDNDREWIVLDCMVLCYDIQGYWINHTAPFFFFFFFFYHAVKEGFMPWLGNGPIIMLSLRTL